MTVKKWLENAPKEYIGATIDITLEMKDGTEMRDGCRYTSFDFALLVLDESTLYAEVIKAEYSENGGCPVISIIAKEAE